MPEDAFSCDPWFLKDLFARPKLFSDVNKAAESWIAQVTFCVFFVTLVCFALLMSHNVFVFYVFPCTLYLIGGLNE